MNDRPGEMDERDVDERFASIVAAWDDPAALPQRGETGRRAVGPTDAGPTAPEQDREADEPEAGPDAPAPPPSGVNPSPLEGTTGASSWRVPEPAEPGATPPALEDEHYDPPPVHLPPQEDLHFWGAVIGLVGGPLLLVYVAMARPFHSTRWFLAGLVLSLLGFALLVLRQPRDRDEDDDGARV
ncbi:hypothetical protein JQN72_07245 [Phycicoccus sp. CSK15P-2]|uniref:hypothetical protein n=1 Tax=Phycicoccus sp. CSK15P-2 TaxID=2807627 RepID=UPI00194F7A92|nr:hypothetical protein [Phycicoccus sp. CSK15P-2]MBM6404036.1 hypothetical protein [Phycicoccus sp. CSK15P-2]